VEEAMPRTKIKGKRRARADIKEMPLQQRLALIVEAVKYCQRVKLLGMPPSCYSKALREPVFFLWECRDGNKLHVPAFRSKSAIGIRFGTHELVYDHAIPFKYVQEALLALSEVTPETVSSILDKYGTSVLITTEENDRLNSAGYGQAMPETWDKVDPLARYKALGIELVENIGRHAQ
jgi:hypothetical protein